MSGKKSIGVIIGTVDKFSKPMKAFNKSTEKLTKKIVDMQKKAGKITGLKDLEKQLGKTASELGESRKKLSALGRELKSTERPTKTLMRAFDSAKTNVQKLSQAHKKHKSALREERTALKDADVDTNKLADSEAKLTKNLDKQLKTLGRITKRRQTLNKITEKMDRAAGRAAKFALIGQGASQFSRGVFNKGQGLVGSVRELDIAKGELASLGVRDVAGVANTGAGLSKRMSGVSSASFVGAAYNIKSGIGSLTDRGVAEMTKAAVITSKATKASSEVMTSLFAAGHGIFKRQFSGQSDKAFGGLFSGAITRSVQQFRTTGGGMQQAIQTMGAGPTNLGMPLSEQLTLLGMLQGVMPAGDAGTATKSFATNIVKAHTEFAKLAADGKNPNLVRLLGKDGMMRSMPDILTDIKKRYGETINAIESAEMKKAFGTEEAVKIIDTLYGQADAFRTNTGEIEKAQEAGLKYTETVAKIADNTPTARLDMLTQRMTLLKESIADKLLSVLDKYHEKIGIGIESLTIWSKEHKNLIFGGIFLTGVLGVLAALLVPLALGFTVLSGVFALFAVLSTPLAVTIGLWALGAAALAGAGYLVWKNWNPLMNFFSNLGRDVKSIFLDIVATILESMKTIMSVMPDWALPKSWESKNIDATIKRYRAYGKSAYKPVNFSLSGSGSSGLGSMGSSLGIDEIIKMVSGETASGGLGGKVQNNIRFDSPITINASEGMSPQAIAEMTRHELEKLVERMQSNVELSVHG